MAGDFIIVRHVTPDKTKIYRIAEALGINRDEALGIFIRAMIWFDCHTEDGNAQGVTVSFLDTILGVSGFGSALESVGWLRVTSSGIVAVRFDSHTSETAKKRAKNNERQRKHRQKESNASEAKESRQKRDKSVTTEQNRTEENRIEDIGLIGAINSSLGNGAPNTVTSSAPEEVERLSAKLAARVIRAKPTPFFVSVAVAFLNGRCAENHLWQAIEATEVARSEKSITSPEAYFRTSLANQIFGKDPNSLGKLKDLLTQD